MCLFNNETIRGKQLVSKTCIPRIQHIFTLLFSQSPFSLICHSAKKLLTMSDQNHGVKFTPLFGDRSDGAVCSLLELGKIRILIDCGKDFNVSSDDMIAIVKDLKSKGGVDLILLSHADTQHISGLPYFLTKNGDSGLGAVPLLCTVPVLKYSRMCLYEHCLQVLTERGGLDGGLPERNDRNRQEMEMFLDSVDQGFGGAVTVKYYEERVLLDVLKESGACPGLDGLSAHDTAEMSRVRLCAYPSGRTVGGSMWKVTHNASEILYVTAASLRKDGILDGCGGSLALLGEGHPLLLLDSASFSTQPGIRPPGGGGAPKAKPGSKREDAVLGTVIPPVLETLRRQGNVLLPVDAGGRILELLYGLNKYWAENQGMKQYPLVFLSNMGPHLKAYAQCQLEWTSDAACRGFYAGHPNPFNFNEVSFFGSVREMELHCSARDQASGRPSPKVVIATDSTLSHGLSKELLIKWGGDPRNSIMMTDYPAPGSLAAEVVSVCSTGAPCILNLTRLQRVVLSASELEELEKEKELVRALEEEKQQQERREAELAALSLPGRKRRRDEDGGSDVESDDEATDDELEEEEAGEGVAIQDGASLSRAKSDSVALSREPSTAVPSGATLAKYTVSKFKVFDNKRSVAVHSTNAENAVTSRVANDEYGSSIADLNFQAAVTGTVGSLRRNRYGKEESHYNPNIKAQAAPAAAAAAAATAAAAAAPRIPTKLVEVTSRIQFTCSFQTLYRTVSGSSGQQGGSNSSSSGVSGHADYRQLRTLLQQLKPKRVVLFHGDAGDTKTLAQYAKTTLFGEEDVDTEGGAAAMGTVSVDASTGAVAGTRGLFCAGVGLPVIMELRSSAVRLIIPNALAPTSRLVPILSHKRTATGGGGASSSSSSGASAGEIVAHVCSLQGAVKEIMLSKLSKQKSDQRVVKLTAVKNDPPLCLTDASGGTSEQQEENKLIFDQMVPTVGAVSIGDISLTLLKNKLEAAGMVVEYQRNMTIGSALTGSLICNQTILIHKTNDNDFSLEGPCNPLYYKVRTILYAQMSFVY